MGWVNWSRKSAEARGDRGPLGVDLNAGRARAAYGRATRNKLHPLDDPRPDLTLAISMEARSAEVGPKALAISRRLPHAVCSGYLPALRQPQEWKHGRHTLTPESATALALDRLRVACAPHDGIAFGLPTYLSVAQVTALQGLTERAKLKVRGTVTVPLALAAERATHYLHGSREEAADAPTRTGRSITTTSVLIVDADDYALTAVVVRISEEEVRVLSSATLPRLGTKFWRERLLDSLSDRCVRLCRRDPRDTADTEQMLFDQIEDAIDRARTGQRVSLSVRSTHWYQDLVHAPADLAAFCTPLCRLAGEEMKNLTAAAGNDGPRAVWLTHDAGRLPGLATALHQAMSERSSVRILHPEAAAAATANLIDRWAVGELPRTHLDTTIPLPPRPDPRLNPPRSQPTHR
jgi:hypothetical protein